MQRMILSRADCIVLMGTGTFVKLAVIEYIDKHPDPSSWCIYIVCVNNHKEYVSVLQSRSENRVSGSWERFGGSDLPYYVGQVNHHETTA